MAAALLGSKFTFFAADEYVVLEPGEFYTDIMLHYESDIATFTLFKHLQERSCAAAMHQRALPKP